MIHTIEPEEVLPVEATNDPRDEKELDALTNLQTEETESEDLAEEEEENEPAEESDEETTEDATESETL